MKKMRIKTKTIDRITLTQKAIMIFYRIKCFNIPKRIIDLFNAKYRHPGILDSNKYKTE